MMFSTHCLLCAGSPHPASLSVHLHCDHASECKPVLDLMPQLLQCFQACAGCDYQCTFCPTVYNLPATGQEDSEQVETRALLAQIHLQHHCPVVLQTGILLFYGCNGSSNHHPGGEQGTAGHSERHGAAPPRTKRRRKGGKEGQEGDDCSKGKP